MFRRLSVLTVLGATLAAATAEDRSVSHPLNLRRAELGLDADHDFLVLNQHKDQRGEVHTRVQQTYKGLPVWGGQAIHHRDAQGREKTLTDALHRDIHVATTPSISVSEALAIVHEHLAPKGAYTHQPTAELVVVPETATVVRPGRGGREINAEDVTRQVLRHTLAYHVHADLHNGDLETRSQDYLVNANTGAIMENWNSLRTAAAVGTGHSQWYGNVTLNTNSTASGYELRDMTRGAGGQFGNNVTTNLSNGTSGNGTVFTDADNVWGDGLQYNGTAGTGANAQTAAVDAHRGLQATWDFYKNVFSRNGIDNTGKATYSRMHYSTQYDNAFWDDTCFCMTYGDGATGGSVGEADLDTAGHEMTHGVCAATANLNYSGESGGLNESNSDIFGTCVEFYTLGAGGAGSVVPDNPGSGAVTANYTMFENSWGHPGTALRYMYKPSLDGSSKDAWSSTLGSLDVHYSSGPNNRMFYFLARGSSSDSTSDFYSSYLPAGMSGIGNDHAARIWYRALTVYLTASSNYAAARTAAISAAKDLYGAGSPEEQAVWNAYAAINVGSKWSGSTGNTVTASITTPSSNVTLSSGASQSFAGTATDSSSSATLSYAWNFGDGSTATGATASHVFTNTGTAAVTRTVTFTATDNTGVSATATRSVTVNPAGGTPLPELVTNGGFESGSTGWSGTTGDINTWSGQPAHGGSKNAWICGNGSTASESLSQSISIPASAASATLTFWMHIDTAETTSSYVYDTLKVQAINGTSTTTLATYSNLNKNTGYVQKTFDLSAFKGKTITLKFAGAEDSSLQTSFVIDDVSVRYQ